MASDTDVPLPARLAAMREEDRPRRDGKALLWHTGALRWMWVAGSYMDDEWCHPRTAELEIDAAQRKALWGAGWGTDERHRPGSHGVVLSGPPGYLVCESLHAAYVSVFGTREEQTDG